MPAIISALVASLLTAARTYLPGIVGRILLTLGIGFATHQVALPAVRSVFQSYWGQLGEVIRAYGGAVGLDVAASIIIGALVAKAAQKFTLTKLGTT